MFMSTVRLAALLAFLLALVALTAGCPKPPPEQVTPQPPAVEPAPEPEPVPAPVERVEDEGFQPMEPTATDLPDLSSLEAIKRSGVLKTVFFAFDRFDLSEATRRSLQENATTLLAHPSWRVRIDGHCDERGTIEYNLELGAKRARAVKDYLIDLGVPADRLETRSLGEERPADPGHDETAWSKNRRAEFEPIAM
jgi:peptidoglycan-associated lipoprotein